ncbi:MAG: family 10 glycosylhydrolase [Armatimonadota bacterium]|nr:family 10 glycosylhydrolase [Armatimonadota bacterium]
MKLDYYGREVIIARLVLSSINTSRAFASVLVCLFILIMAVGASCAARPEFRGAWVTGWSSGYLTPAEADKTIAAAKAANINALFIQVRKVGDAYYQSDYEPLATNIAGPPDYDPLAYIIERAHSEGLEVHAWVNLLRVQSSNSTSFDPAHVCNAHPEWLMCDVSGSTKSADGVFLDPGVPEVRDYTTQVVMDIARRYDVDGIHLDYIRYPGREWGYNSESVSRFNSRFGRVGDPDPADPKWSDWRREQVTGLVRNIYKRINAVKPNVKVSAATVSWGECSSSFEDTLAYTKVFQDWAGWMREGIIDASILMNYRDERKSSLAGQYRRWLQGMQRWQYGRHVYAGQMVYSEYITGAVAQLEASRASGSDGMVCFSFNDTPSRAALVSALKRSVYTGPAAVPTMSWKERFARAPSKRVRMIPF